jgi:hypothetical protein
MDPLSGNSVLNGIPVTVEPGAGAGVDRSRDRAPEHIGTV